MPRKQKSRSGGPIVRKRTSTQHDPRTSKRARKENDNPDATDLQSRHGSPSPGPSQTGMPDIHDGMSQEQLYLAARQLQAQNNELHHSQQEADRTALGDITNNAGSDEDEDDNVTEAERKFVRSIGKKFIVTHLLWMPDEDAVFEDALDDDYNPLERFSKEPGMQPQSRIQGAIRDMLDVLPKDYQTPDQLKGFVRTEFLAGMKDQRYAYRNRLRANPALFDHTILEFSSSDEREKFSESIGRKAKKSKPDEFYYDTFNVPLLHEDYDGEFDVDKIFLNRKLFILHAALTKGLSGATALVTGKAPRRVETVDKLWGLKKTMPSMIASDAIWLRWLHSRDEEFLPVGDVTGINWAREFDAYMRFLTEGLEAQTDCVVNIFRRWDKVFYPNSDEGTARDGEYDLDEVNASQDAAMEALRERASA
ncbi:hypothetical protein GGX14DRAFT_660565 [Mycena pura]|uniref:Uncharacterized protein n=1 Tax=Mycena pura TaxID=153505 RepID=A0AAD6YB31_9AGAR|nr:hypothetical protein GGX14DRAFT_660565 [Mycena pura]